MEKVWLKQYPKTIPPEIGKLAYESIVDLLEKSSSLFAERPAVSNMGSTFTYRQVRDMAHHFAAFLQQDLKLQKGERIAIMLPNCVQYYVALYASLRAGLTVVNINPLYTARELTYQLNDSGANTIICMQNFARTVQESLPNTPAVKNVIVTGLGDLFPAPKSFITNFVIKYVKKLVPPFSLPKAVSFNKALKSGKKSSFKNVALNLDDLAFIQYTGGTTGVSKGAMLTHRNCLSNLEQIRIWIEPVTKPGEEVIIIPLPLYHAYAFLVMFSTFDMGNKAILITNPRDIPHFISELKHNKFTSLCAVNTLYNLLLNEKGFSEIDFSHLKLSSAGGMSLQPVIAEKWKKATGKHINQGYGLTEVVCAATSNPVYLEEFTGSIGVPIPGTDVTIRDKDGRECGFNEEGELWIKGPQVMQGYWQKPAETANVFSDGWFKTGDIVRMDEKGFIYIVDRKKNMIVVSGLKVFPNEVEAVISAHPKVFEVAVIGVPDERSGEGVKAFIVKKDETLTEAELREYFNKNLAHYKHPKVIEFCKEIPKSPVGKILHYKLREEDAKRRAKIAA